MSVLDALEQEHRVFRRLAESLERTSTYPEAQLRQEVRGTLLVLFHGLERHERIEDAVFKNRQYATQRGASRLLGALDRQHHEILSIRAGLNELLLGATLYKTERLRGLIIELTQKLRRHFDHEERLLWPHYRRCMRRSVDRSLARRTGRMVKDLELSIAASRRAVSHYLGKSR